MNQHPKQAILRSRKRTKLINAGSQPNPLLINMPRMYIILLMRKTLRLLKSMILMKKAAHMTSLKLLISSAIQNDLIGRKLI